MDRECGCRRKGGNPVYFKKACPILADWESSTPADKNLVRSLYADTFREFKGCRPASEWASLYAANQLPGGIIKLFETIQNFLAGTVDPGSQHVLS